MISPILLSSGIERTAWAIVNMGFLPAEADALIQEYQDHLLIERRLAKSTIREYSDEIGRFFLFLRTKDISPLESDPISVVEYLIDRSENAVGGRTLAKVQSMLHSFFDFLIDDTYRLDDPTVPVEKPAQEMRLPEVLSTGQVNLLLSCMQGDDPLSKRDRAFFELIYSCGLRIHEACNLRMRDVYLEERMIQVIGKRDRQRIIPMGAIACDLIREYLKDVRPSLSSQRVMTDGVFLTRSGRPLGRKGAWKRFKGYCAEAGITAKVHTLRHSFATHILNGGADLRIVQELLGHRDIRTTQIYTHLGEQDLRRSHAKYHPHGKES